MMNRQEIQALYDPQQFRKIGHELIGILSDYLDNSLRGEGRVLDFTPPQTAQLRWRQPLPRTAAFNTDELLNAIRSAVLGESLHIHHPRNLGHQVAPPLPVAALCDLVAALTNQAMAVYETGPSATMMERKVMHWLAQLIGWTTAEGVLTSGGAQANLTALLAARQCMAGWDVWRDGIAGGARLRLLASENAHYSVSRAAGIMGLGTDAAVKVSTDVDGRLDLASLHAAWEACVARGDKPFVVVATAGTTPTGSIDPLEEIAAFCRTHGLWMHVDGAHGASALLSDRHKAALDGIVQADSVVWDGHKLLYMPATVSAVLFRDPRKSYAAFAQEASYLFHGDSDESESYNISYRTLECTKRMMGLKLWAVLSLYGCDTLGGLVDQVFSTARLFASKLADAPDFELLMAPQTNIVCFRHMLPLIHGDATMNSYQAALRQRIVESGAFHLTQTTINGNIWLRVTIMNPLTIAEDLEALMVLIRKLSGTVIKQVVTSKDSQ